MAEGIVLSVTFVPWMPPVSGRILSTSALMPASHLHCGLLHFRLGLMSQISDRPDTPRIQLLLSLNELG